MHDRPGFSGLRGPARQSSSSTAVTCAGAF